MDSLGPTSNSTTTAVEARWVEGGFRKSWLQTRASTISRNLPFFLDTCAVCQRASIDTITILQAFCMPFSLHTCRTCQIASMTIDKSSKISCASFLRRDLVGVLGGSVDVVRHLSAVHHHIQQVARLPAQHWLDAAVEPGGIHHKEFRRHMCAGRHGARCACDEGPLAETIACSTCLYTCLFTCLCKCLCTCLYTCLYTKALCLSAAA